MKKYILCLFFSAIYSQEYKKTRTFNSDKNISSSDLVYTVVPDNEGYIWFATDNGVFKYNGTYFKNFSIKEGLPSNDIFEFTVDSKNRKWLGGYFNGLYYIYKDKLFYVKESKNKNLHFNFEKQDTVFFNTFQSRKLYYYTNKNRDLKEYPTKNNLVIVGYSSFLEQYMAYQSTTLNFYILNNNKEVIKVLPKNSKYFSTLTTRHFAYVFDNEKYKTNPFSKHFPEKIFIIKKNKTEELLNGLIDYKNQKTVELLSRRDDKIYKIYNVKNKKCIVFKNDIYNSVLSKEISNLPINLANVHHISIDLKGNYWVVNKNNKSKFIPKDYKKITNYTNTFIFKDDETSIVSFEVINNNAYFLTNKNSFYQYDLKTKKLKLIKQYVSHIVLRQIFKNNDGFIISTSEGFDRFKFHNNNLINIEFNRVINRTCFPIKNTIYYTRDQKIFKFYNKPVFSDPLTIRFNNLIVDNEENIFVSNENQISKYNQKEKKYSLNAKIEQSNVIQLKDNLLLVGTNSNGLLILTKDLKILQKILLNENISRIYSNDNSNSIIVGTNKGLHLLKLINGVIYDIRKISDSDGLISGKIRDIKINRQHIYVITQEGFSIIYEDILKESIIGKIEINNIKCNGETYNHSEKIIFNRNQNNLTISTSINTFSNKDNFKKYYSLTKEGEKPKWENFIESEISFKELNYGNYIFKVYSTTSTDNKVKNIQQFRFEIKPYYWETNWFKIFLILCFVVIFILLFQFFRVKQKKKLNLKLALNNLELKVLKAQMNPHYIFNSLNNLQQTMFADGIVAFNKQIVLFSKHLRKTLDIINSDMINLKDEIDYIKSYLDIESFKQNDQIYLDINKSTNIALEKIFIPVMILQPIVENSIIHGFKEKTGNRKLEIEINIEKETLCISIKDNGVGRDLNAKNERNYKSYANNIIQERFNLLNKHNRTKRYHIEIIDLCNENKPSGTMVKLSFALIIK